jgi:uncharacterized membrane protein YccC
MSHIPEPLPPRPPGRRYVAMAIGTLLGAGLWSAFVLLDMSPWDGGLRYLGLLFVAGVLLAAIDPGGVWPGPAGLYAGQAIVMAAELRFAPEGPEPLPMRFLFLVSMTLSAVLGAAILDAFRIWFETKPEPGDPSNLAS